MLLTYLQELDVFENAAAYDAAAELGLRGENALMLMHSMTRGQA